MSVTKRVRSFPECALDVTCHHVRMSKLAMATARSTSRISGRPSPCLPRSCLVLLPRPGMKHETNALHEGLLGAQLPWERRWARRGGVSRCCCLICRCNLAPGVAFGSLLIILNSLFLLWFAGGFAFDPNHGVVFRMITFFQFMAALVSPRAPLLPPLPTEQPSAVGQCKRL
jgi:hypothetical protein